MKKRVDLKYTENGWEFLENEKGKFDFAKIRDQLFIDCPSCKERILFEENRFYELNSGISLIYCPGCGGIFKIVAVEITDLELFGDDN